MAVAPAAVVVSVPIAVAGVSVAVRPVPAVDLGGCPGLIMRALHRHGLRHGQVPGCHVSRSPLDLVGVRRAPVALRVHREEDPECPPEAATRAIRHGCYIWRLTLAVDAAGWQGSLLLELCVVSVL